MSIRHLQRRRRVLRNAICRQIRRKIRENTRLTGGLQLCLLSAAVPLDFPVIGCRRKIIGAGVSILKGLCAEVVSEDREKPYQLPVALIPTDVLMEILEHMP